MIKYETKRSTARYNVNFQGYYSLKKYNKDSLWNKCRIIDLSTSGTALAISDFIMTGDIMKIRLIAGDKEIIQDGLVVNKSNNRVGIKFFDISPTEEKSLAYVIHKDHISSKTKKINNLMINISSHSLLA